MTDLTITGLIEAYKTDPISPYHKLRHRTRVNVDGVLRRIKTREIIAGCLRLGDVRLCDLKAVSFLKLHVLWSSDGKHLPMAHSMMASVRTVVNFGLLYLENRECERISAVLHRMKIPMGAARDHFLTAEQADAIRAQAHEEGCPSIALAQAIQFEGTFRQKDLVGEFVPMSEPGVSEITRVWKTKKITKIEKWLRGLRWNEIDENLILRHITSKKLKPVEVDLKFAPMVLEELQAMFCELGEPLTRARLPASGPVIVDEETGIPYLTHAFRRRWRELARAVGIPDDVQNRDTRAGAITEAISFGVSIDDAGKAAAHSTTQMTARYSRGQAAATVRSMKKRAENRGLKPAAKSA